MDLEADVWWTETAAPEPELTEKQKAWALEKARNRAARHKPIPLSEEDVKPSELSGRAARRARERGAESERRNRSRIQRTAARRGVKRAYQ